MRKLLITLTGLVVVVSAVTLCLAQGGGTKDNIQGMQGMMNKEKMAICPMHELMMGSMMPQSIAAMGDGGFVIIAGNKLSKYDKDLNRVKEVEFKMDMGLVGPASSEGLYGPAGMRGQTGAMGVAGDLERGRTGATGSAGLANTQGSRSNTTERAATTTRSTGTMSPIGPVGPQAVRGEKGDKGVTLGDPNGAAGQRGLASSQGTTGRTGAKSGTTAGAVGSTGPVGEKMEKCPMHEMQMGSMMAQSLVAMGDGGFVVLAGNKLSKYDKDLNLVKDVQVKMDMGFVGPASPENPYAPAGMRGQTGATGVAGDLERGRTGATGSAGFANAQGSRSNTTERAASTIRSTDTMSPIVPAGPQAVRSERGDKGLTLGDPNGTAGQRVLTSSRGTAGKTGAQSGPTAGGMGSAASTGEKMEMRPMNEMQMGSMMAHSIAAMGDGGFVIMAGNKLSKYDKDLNLVKDVQVKIDMEGMQNKISQMMEKCPMCKSIKQGDSRIAEGWME